MTATQPSSPPVTLYDTDYMQWITTTVDKLRRQDYSLVDWANLLSIKPLLKLSFRQIRFPVNVSSSYLRLWTITFRHSEFGKVHSQRIYLKETQLK